METVKATLFISKESAVYEYTRRQVEEALGQACKDQAGFRLDVIDIADRPELAEEMNIEALPTLVIGNKRFVGVPNKESLANCTLFASMPAGSPS